MFKSSPSEVRILEFINHRPAQQGILLYILIPSLLQEQASVHIATEGSINVLCSASCELQSSGQAITYTIKHNEGLDRA